MTCCKIDATKVEKQFRLCREGSTDGRAYQLFDDPADEALLVGLTIEMFAPLFDQIRRDNGELPEEGAEDDGPQPGEDE